MRRSLGPTLTAWDRSLFQFLNQDLATPWLDPIMAWITASSNWRAPLFLLLLFLLVRGPASLRWTLLGAGLVAGLTDLVSSQLLKPLWHAPRPCIFESSPRLLVGIKRSGSLPSSHAANLLAVGVYLQGRMTPRLIWLPLALLTTAILYSRIYVGVHYPSDILGGTLLGILLGRAALGLPLPGSFKESPGSRPT